MDVYSSDMVWGFILTKGVGDLGKIDGILNTEKHIKI